MKNSEVLFLAIGGLEASRLEQSELAPRKRARPRLLLTAALIALTLLLVGCAAAIYRRIHIHYTQYEAPTATVSQTEDSSEKNVLTDCYPQAVCEGYTMTGGAPMDRTTQNLRYSNDVGKTISYSISTSHAIDGALAQPSETSTLTVFGWEATRQVSGYGEGGQAITWHNKTNGYYASLFTDDVSADIQAMAESVAFGPRLPLSFLCKQTYVTDADSLEAVAQITMGDTPAEMRTVHGCTGAAAIRGNQAKVVWIEGTAEKGISFALSSPDYSIEELLAIAESVQKQ